MRTTTCSGCPPRKIRRHLCARASGGHPSVYARNDERLRKDDPRLGQPHALWRARYNAVGEGGPELVKQLLNRTYDIKAAAVVAVYLTGRPHPGVGPQDVALAIIGAVFKRGYVKNKVMEFIATASPASAWNTAAAST